VAFIRSCVGEALKRSIGLLRCRISWYDSVEVTNMTFTVEYEREDDGRWLAEVVELPGVLAYGSSSDEAIAKAQALALRVLADRLEHGYSKPEFVSISFAAA
jgi:predicted RNase H-like HicB family nuclease